MTLPTLSRLAAAALCLFALPSCSKSEGPSKANVTIAPPPPGVQQVKVIVDATGFQPSEVRLEKGTPASVVFVRTTESTCAKDVVFPELKLERRLPLDTPVAIDIPTGDARTLVFQCGMGMYKIAVVVH
jgi:plastocyanin domain-containing protein